MTIAAFMSTDVRCWIWLDECVGLLASVDDGLAFVVWHSPARVKLEFSTLLTDEHPSRGIL